MNEQQAREAILALLRQKGRATNSEMQALIGLNRELFERIREELILDDLAADKNGVGLVWKGEGVSDKPAPKPDSARLFLSYGRRDAKDLADRLAADLKGAGFDVWLDTREITTGMPWQTEIVDGLRSAQVVIALLSPHSVRVRGSAGNPENVDSVCLGEIAYALYNPPPRPVVPVMAARCEAPLCIFHLDYVDLCRWRDSDSEYQAGFKRLLDGIAAALNGETRYRSWHHQLNPWDFAAYLNEKRRGFTGREWLFDEIDAWRVGSNDRALLIAGDPGVGKSAIVAQLVHLNPEGQVIAYHCCQADTQATLEPWRIVRSLAAMIASRVDAYAAQLDDPNLREALSEANCRRDPASAFEEGILTPLEALPAPPGGTRYLLIDALDEGLALSEPGLNVVQLLATRIDRMPGWLRIVATTRKEPEVLSRLAGLRARELDAQDPRNLEDLERYMAARLETPNLAQALAHSRLPQGRVIQTLKQKSEGNFLYVRQALEGIERGNYRFDQLDRLPPGLFGLYQSFFERTFPDESRFTAARRLLDVVSASAEPLAEEELAAASGLDPEEELPAAMQSLAVYLPRRIGLGERRTYSFFHKSLEDWLTHPDRRAQLYSASRKRGHRQLADWAWAQYATGLARLSPYARRYLPAHLIGAECWDDLETLLTDLKYLESRNAAGEIFSLVTDFRQAIATLPSDRPQRQILKLLEEALRRDIHFIDRHREDYPQGLFQCLWNSCWWFDCPQAATYYIEPKGGWSERPPGEAKRGRLCDLLAGWRAAQDGVWANRPWIRSLRPPAIHLGTGQQAVLRGHASYVTSVAFSPDGRRIASGSYDQTVRVWDAETGAELRLLRGHVKSVTSVAFSPDGRRIASGSWDGTVRVWDAETGAELRLLRGHEHTVGSVAFSPDGRRIASDSGETVRVWDVETGTELHVLRGHERSVDSVAFSPDGRRIASGSEDHTVRVWDAETGAELLLLRGHEDRVMSVAFSPDGRRIASGSGDHTVRVWDAETGAELHRLRGHDKQVESVAFSPDGRRIASGSHDGAVGTVRVWDAETGTELRLHRGHENVVTSVAFSPDGRRIASGSGDSTVRVWDAETGAELRLLRGHKSRVDSVVFSPDGQRIASGSWDHSVRVWDAETGAELRLLRGHENGVVSVAFSPDGRRIASGSADSTVRVWDAETGAELRLLRGHKSWVVQSVAFSPDGRRIASGSWDKTVQVWDAETGAELRLLRGHEGVVWSVAFSADRRRIASGSDDQTVRVWDAETGTELRLLRGHKSRIESVAFSSDGRRIVSGSDDQTVRVWDAATAECLKVIEGFGDAATIAIAMEMGRLWALVREGATVIEDSTTGRIVARFPDGFHPLAGHSNGRLWAGGGNQLELLRLEDPNTAGSSDCG